MKKFSILIPQYNETDEVVKPLLDSIMMQKAVDLSQVEVVICNDGSDVHLTDKLLNNYPFDVHYHLCEHRGVSATRNACYDKSEGEYVCWCDADDCWYSVSSFWLLFREMDMEGGFDGLIGNFMEQSKHPETGEFLFLEHPMNQTFYHSTVWRRKYLDDNNLRADDSLTVHEDHRCIALFSSCSDNIKYCPVPLYLWCWNDNSVCRRDPKYILKTMINMLQSNTSLIEELIHRGLLDKAMMYVTSMIYDGYYMMNCKEWKDINNKEYRDSTFAEMKKYYKKYRHLFDKVQEQDKLMISNQIRQRHIMEGKFEMENVLFSDWLIKLNS